MKNGDPRFFHLAYPGGGRHTLEQQQKEGRPLERRECETRYELAAAILPSRLRRIAMELPETDKKRAEEFRLRAGRAVAGGHRHHGGIGDLVRHRR